jgi:hypothetical protein
MTLIRIICAFSICCSRLMSNAVAITWRAAVTRTWCAPAMGSGSEWRWRAVDKRSVSLSAVAQTGQQVIVDRTGSRRRFSWGETRCRQGHAAET